MPKDPKKVRKFNEIVKNLEDAYKKTDLDNDSYLTIDEFENLHDEL